MEGSFLNSCNVCLGDNFDNNVENGDGKQLSLKRGRKGKPCLDFSYDFLSISTKTLKISCFL